MSQIENTLMRAIRGPILMIALGVLLVADRTSSLSFGRTWPVLIIAFGVMKLLERVGVSSGSTAAPDGSTS